MTQHPAPAGADPASPALQAWQAFAQLGSDLFVLLDARGFVQWVNPAFERVSGWSRTQAAGKRNRRTGAVLKPGLVSREMMHAWLAEKGVILRGGGLDESPHVRAATPRSARSS